MLVLYLGVPAISGSQWKSSYGASEFRAGHRHSPASRMDPWIRCKFNNRHQELVVRKRGSHFRIPVGSAFEWSRRVMTCPTVRKANRDHAHVGLGWKADSADQTCLVTSLHCTCITNFKIAARMFSVVNYGAVVIDLNLSKATWKAVPDCCCWADSSSVAVSDPKHRVEPRGQRRQVI
ncbi:hypothetical protein N657DRAFT_88386 [Parathielavia appendiculata]|uniref:Uncharacterized protein n=1 Tax=Parathielavia appendiculata TaxID=2587402 RepID=A0AAN6UAV4_9PEZI|nr:hypothetical protein N657DRAFT_88386 [Parathielavia appendiculata]